MSSNDISDEGIEELLAALKSEQASKNIHLDLRNCNIGNKGAEAIYKFYSLHLFTHSFMIDFCDNVDIDKSLIEQFLCIKLPFFSETASITGSLAFGTRSEHQYQMPPKFFKITYPESTTVIRASFDGVYETYTLHCKSRK